MYCLVYHLISLKRMIPSHKRLTGKDIQYGLRRWKKLYGDMFICSVFDQYPNRKRHQVSIQIPVKLDKRATTRNRLKKVAMAVFQDLLEEYYTPHKKRFVFVNKKHLQEMKEILATSSKTTIVKRRREYCVKDFTKIITTPWKTNWLRRPRR